MEETPQLHDLEFVCLMYHIRTNLTVCVFVRVCGGAAPKAVRGGVVMSLWANSPYRDLAGLAFLPFSNKYLLC